MISRHICLIFFINIITCIMVPFFLILCLLINLSKCDLLDIHINPKLVLRIASEKWIGEYEDTRDMLYCNTICSDNEKPVICNCKKRINIYPECVYYYPNRQIDFRLQMTFIINAFRNLVATGILKSVFYIGGSSEMNVVSYDMGLEYSAQCSAHRCSKDKETCIKMALFPVIKQLVIHKVLKEFTTMRNVAKSILEDLLQSMTHDIDKNKKQHNQFSNSGGYATSVQTEWTVYQTVLWSRATAFGCAIKQTQTDTEENIEIFIVCNFGASRENPNSTIYKLGDSCTSCDKNASANGYFESLCGLIGLIPISNIYDGNGYTKTYREKNPAILVLGGILIHICYRYTPRLYCL